MTVASEVSRSGPYNGNGVTTVFDYDFRIVNEAHLKVIRADADGNETVLVLGADYTVSGVGADEGSITASVAPAIGLTITILRNVPLTQETDLENQGPYFAETVEAAFDLAAMRDQQLQEQLTRAVLIPASEDDPDGSLSAQLAQDITRLAQSADEIDTVAAIEDDVVTVAGIAGDVALLADVSPVLSGTASAVRMDEKMFTGDGVDTTWTLDREPGVEENVLVWVGGAIQDTADYSVVGTTLTITPAVANGVEIRTLTMTMVTANDVEQMRDETEAARDQALAVAAALPPIVANTMLVDNAAGALRETKTFAAVRALLGVPTVASYGAAVDGVTVENAAVADMTAALGEVVFGRGAHAIDTITIDVPVTFEDGAYITIAAGQTVTIRNRITSARQWVFRGDGDIIINIAGAVGEDAKNVHASWFGVFPQNTSTLIQTALINKMFSAFNAQTREGVIDLDCGSYRIDGTITVPRGIWLRGSGTRRTVFDLVGNGYDAIVTGGDAVRLTGIHFEQPSGSEAEFTGNQLVLAHSGCEAWDIRVWNCRNGVLVSGGNCDVQDVTATIGVSVDADSRVIAVTGAGCTVDGVKVNSTTGHPGAIVEIGKGAVATVARTQISRIQTTQKSVPVKITADTSNVIGVNIHDVYYGSSGGGNIEAVVKIKTSGSAAVQGVIAGLLNSNSLADALVSIDQGSSGSTRDVVIASGVTLATGIGINLVRTAGTLDDITIADAVDLSDCATPISRTGTMTNVRFSAGMSGKITLNDGTATSITPPNVGGFCMFVTEGTTDDGPLPQITRSGIVCYDVGSSVAIEKSSAGGANFAVVATNVTGATGVAGNVTIGILAPNLRVENQSGGIAVIRYSFS